MYPRDRVAARPRSPAPQPARGLWLASRGVIAPARARCPRIALTRAVPCARPLGSTYSILSREFIDDGNGNVKAVRTVNIAVGADGRFEELEGTEKEWPADLVILAMGACNTPNDAARAHTRRLPDANVT